MTWQNRKQIELHHILQELVPALVLRGWVNLQRLVRDCLLQGKRCGFRLLQFNAVVASNLPARHLYERLGFVPLGTIPGGFRKKDGQYEDICLYYYEL